MLIIETDLFDHNNNVCRPAINVPQTLSLEKGVALKDLVVEKDSGYTYDLVSFITFDGSSKREGKYVSNCRRELTKPSDNGGEKIDQWIKFERLDYQEISDSVLFKQKHSTQMLFYVHAP